MRWRLWLYAKQSDETDENQIDRHYEIQNAGDDQNQDPREQSDQRGKHSGPDGQGATPGLRESRADSGEE